MSKINNLGTINSKFNIYLHTKNSMRFVTDIGEQFNF